MIAEHETVLGDGDPLTLPPGDTPWCVSRGKIEVYLLSAERRRLVIVVGAGEHLFPLPAGSDLALVLLAPEGAAIQPSQPTEDLAASAQLWLDRADGRDAVAADAVAGVTRDETPVRAIQNFLVALHAAHARADAERDATDLARLARQDPAAGAATAGDGGLRDALATIAAAFRLPGARPTAPVSPAADISAVPQLARAMGFRARRVTLPGDWPRDNLGPLIMCRVADGAIVALLWRGGRYLAPDGPVDDQAAAQFESWAYVAHAPLSPRVVDLLSLGRAVLGGAGEEMPWIVACGLGVALVGLIVPLATGWLFQDIVPSGQGGLLVAVGIALVAAAIVQLVLGAARGLAQARIEGPSSVRLAAGLTDRLLKLPTRFFKTLSAGDLNQRIQAVETMRALVVGVVLSSGVTAVFSIIYLGLLFSYDVRLALIALAVAVVYVLALLGSRLLQIGPLREAAAIDGRISGLVYETLEGIAKLRTAAAERRALARWRGLYVKEQEVAVRGDRIGSQFDTFADVWQIVALAGLFAVAALLRDHGISAARFIGFLAGYAIFQASFVTFCEAVLRLLAAQPLAERARVLLTAETEGKVGSADPGRLTGLIEVSGVSFGYTADGPPLLSQLSFTLMPGEHIAIVGGSGSGKSTVLRLLLGFEAARTGAIFYDGQDLAALDPARVRQQIGVVLQSSRLFAGTILENIRGSGDLSLEQCMRAAELAGLARDLELLPMGLHTAITEGAGTLSGGQRQRVLIARAIASEPRILFLDEATSALDNVTQAIVAKTIDSMKVSRVTIAHRLSTVRNADKICVLVDGRFVETGHYRDLIARGGAFTELAQRQLLGD